MARMELLPRKEDPTGFLSLFRMAAMDRFGDPSGVIQGRGRWHHPRKAGPGRRNTSARGECSHGAKWVGKEAARR
jgi:hypothetical protein